MITLDIKEIPRNIHDNFTYTQMHACTQHIQQSLYVATLAYSGSWILNVNVLPLSVAIFACNREKPYAHSICVPCTFI